MTAPLALVPSLDDLVAVVNREHEQATTAGRAMVAHAIAAGEALLAAKAQIGQGGWERWLRASFPDKHPKTLRTYMRVAKYRDRIEAELPRTLAAAQKILAGEAVVAHDDETKAAARRLRDQGLSYRAIGDELAVDRHTVNGWLNPKVAERRRARNQQQSREARRAQTREQRSRDARGAGGGLAEAYALIRRTPQALEAAGTEEGSREAKAEINTAMQRAYAAEDHISKAVRLHADREVAA